MVMAQKDALEEDGQANGDGKLPQPETPHQDNEEPNTFSVYNQWTQPQTSGHLPDPRYKHGAAVIQDKMYVYGGNHNDSYLGDLHVLDLKNWIWSTVETKVPSESQATLTPTPCVDHSLVPWGNKLLSIGGHTKDPSESMQVKVFDTHTSTWSMIETYGKPPVSRGGQSVTVVGKTLVIFGGQDAKRSLLNDLHIFDLETKTWSEKVAKGSLPSARSGHAAAVHAERYLFIFGGGSHETCLNDLHVLDLQTMEWSRVETKVASESHEASTQTLLSPCAGHSLVPWGNKLLSIGGHTKDPSESMQVKVFDTHTSTWSMIETYGKPPVSRGGQSVTVVGKTLVIFGGQDAKRSLLNDLHIFDLETKTWSEKVAKSSLPSEDVLVVFGGYNGRYNNQNLPKPIHKSTLLLETFEKVFRILQPTLSVPIELYMKMRKGKYSFVGDQNCRPLEPKDPLGYFCDAFTTVCSQSMFRELEYQNRNNAKFVTNCNKFATRIHNGLAKGALMIIGEPSTYSQMKTYQGSRGMYAIVRVAVPVAIGVGWKTFSWLLHRIDTQKKEEEKNKWDSALIRRNEDAMAELKKVRASQEKLWKGMEMLFTEKERRAKEENRHKEILSKVEKRVANLEKGLVIANWTLGMKTRGRQVEDVEIWKKVLKILPRD